MASHVVRDAEIPPESSPGIAIQRFRRISNPRALGAILGDYLIIAGLIALAVRVDHAPVTLVAIVLIAGRQVALTNLMHAAGHYSLFTPRKWNERLEFLYAYPIFDSVSTYRGDHLDHHAEFARESPERFAYLHDELRLPDLGVWGRTWVVFVRGFLGYSGLLFVFETAKALVRSPRFALKMILFWTPVFGLCAGMGWMRYLGLFWLLPLCLIYPVFNMWAEISDHFQAADDSRNQVGVFHFFFFKGHDFYHGLHHRYPTIPFYRLSEVHEYLATTGESLDLSAGFLDFVRTVYRFEPSRSLPEDTSRFRKTTVSGES
jgi:fatty acid desaturase